MNGPTGSVYGCLGMYLISFVLGIFSKAVAKEPFSTTNRCRTNCQVQKVGQTMALTLTLSSELLQRGSWSEFGRVMTRIQNRHFTAWTGETLYLEEIPGILPCESGARPVPKSWLRRLLQVPKTAGQEGICAISGLERNFPMTVTFREPQTCGWSAKWTFWNEVYQPVCSALPSCLSGRGLLNKSGHRATR